MMWDLGVMFLVIVTFVFTMDDLFIDLVALFRRLKPRLIKDLDLLRMQSLPQHRIAIIIANWKESDVIERMVRGNIRRLRYDKYHFFLGVYPNDIETLLAAQRVAKLFPSHVSVIINTQPGPTSKGQMLNEIVQQVLKSENGTGLRWDAFLMQDSEDVLHPYSLSLLNEACGYADFVQLPVYSFAIPFNKWIGGVYMDEFSEVHTKDLLVRCELGAAVPSAGVGTLIQRGLVLKLMETQQGNFLNENTLTEDYQLGLVSKMLGFKTHFLCAALEEGKGNMQVIATREYFPDSLRASVRQKARWCLGIVYQGMDSLKWRGPWIDKYFLWRDRRGPLNALLILLSTLFFLMLIVSSLVKHDFSSMSESKPLAMLLIVNSFQMSWRIIQRIRFVASINGWRSSLGVLPRWFVANLINILSAFKAHNDYRASVKRGVLPAWQKTVHVLPAEFGQEGEAQL